VLNVLVSSGADAQVSYWTVNSDHIWHTSYIKFSPFLIVSSFSYVFGTRMDGRSKRTDFCRYRQVANPISWTLVFSSTKIKCIFLLCMKPRLPSMKQQN
jgi:hypothetical protein